MAIRNDRNWITTTNGNCEFGKYIAWPLIEIAVDFYANMSSREKIDFNATSAVRVDVKLSLKMFDVDCG